MAELCTTPGCGAGGTGWGQGLGRPWGCPGQSWAPTEAGVSAEFAAVPATMELLKEHLDVTREPPWEALHAAAAGTARPWAGGSHVSPQLYPT